MPLAYHVLHEGRRMGPYDRRTIVGLRIKKTLGSDDQLEASDGSRLTVGQLIDGRPAAASFNSLRTGGYSSARHVCSANLIDSGPGPVEIPDFRDEVEVRIHADVLRIAGSYRIGRAIKEGRVKLAIKDIAHVRCAGSRVDLWLRAGDPPTGSLGLQRLALDLFSEDAARELLQWLPDAQPWLDAGGAPLVRGKASSNASVSSLLWAAVIGITLVTGFVLWVALRRSF